jgi:hypothetical protein
MKTNSHHQLLAMHHMSTSGYALLERQLPSFILIPSSQESCTLPCTLSYNRPTAREFSDRYQQRSKHYSASSVNVDTRLRSIRQGSDSFFTSLSGAKTRQQSWQTDAHLRWRNLTSKNDPNQENQTKIADLFSYQVVIMSK